MSIQSEIDRITNNVQDTIDVIEQTGVSIPAGANSDNLPSLAQALANEKQDKLTGTQGQVVGFDEDGNAVPQAASPPSSTTITLTAAGWTGSAAPFSQQVSCSIVAADTAVVVVDVDTPGTDADADAKTINAWALCTQQNPTQGAGTLTFYCTEKPTINIPVKVGVV